MEALAGFFHEYAPMLWQGLGETCLMTFGALLCSYALGLPLGVLLTLTAPGGMWRRKRLHALLGTITDVGRSVPFLILMLALIPFTRLVAGTTIGPRAALVPLVAGAAPFVARLVESALAQVDPNLVESTRAWGATPLQTAWRVLLPEAAPALVRGLAITGVTLTAYSAMAGAVGAGGLGDIAIRYGYHRYEYGVMMATLVLLILFVQLLQGVCALVARRMEERVR